MFFVNIFMSKKYNYQQLETEVVLYELFIYWKKINYFYVQNKIR